MNQSPGAPPMEIYLLGLVDFQDVLSLQRRIVYDLGDGGCASLLLCEHPPTISVGRAGSRAHIVADDDSLVRWGSGRAGSTGVEGACCICPASSRRILSSRCKARVDAFRLHARPASGHCRCP